MKRKKTKTQPNPVAADLPQNPEFQEFVGNLRRIVSVPKTEIDRMLAEEKEAKDSVILDPPICD